MRPIIGVNGDCLWLCGDVCHSPPSLNAKAVPAIAKALNKNMKNLEVKFSLSELEFRSKNLFLSSGGGSLTGTGVKPWGQTFVLWSTWTLKPAATVSVEFYVEVSRPGLTYKCVSLDARHGRLVTLVASC